MMPSTLVPSLPPLPSLALSPSHSHSRDEWASDLANFETSKGSRRKNNKCRRDSGDSQSRPCRAAWARGPRVKSATGACDSGTSRIHTGAPTPSCPALPRHSITGALRTRGAEEQAVGPVGFNDADNGLKYGLHSKRALRRDSAAVPASSSYCVMYLRCF